MASILMTQGIINVVLLEKLSFMEFVAIIFTEGVFWVCVFNKAISCWCCVLDRPGFGRDLISTYAMKDPPMCALMCDVTHHCHDSLFVPVLDFQHDFVVYATKKDTHFAHNSRYVCGSSCGSQCNENSHHHHFHYSY